MAVLKASATALLLASWLVAAARAARPEPVSLTEAEAKASFLYNLALFVEWPPTAFGKPSTLVIGSAGSSAVVAALRTVEGRLVNGRSVQVRALQAGDDPRGCQILYFGELEREGHAWLGELDRAPVLTVGDHDRFLNAGGMIRVSFENARLKFDVELARTDNSGLKISSKVLGLARVLRNGHVVRD